VLGFPYSVEWPPQAVPTHEHRQACAVGIARNATPTDFRIDARNSSGTERGASAFYWAAVAPSDGTGQSPTALEDPFLAAGRVRAGFLFHPDYQQGEWQRWDVYFRRPFLTPPIVLLTANDLKQDGSSVPREQRVPPTLGVAQNVTTHGFTIWARNTGEFEGEAGFEWVALGCALGCG
jgi:hypothetical protein